MHLEVLTVVQRVLSLHSICSLAQGGTPQDTQLVFLVHIELLRAASSSAYLAPQGWAASMVGQWGLYIEIRGWEREKKLIPRNSFAWPGVKVGERAEGANMEFSHGKMKMYNTGKSVQALDLCISVSVMVRRR